MILSDDFYDKLEVGIVAFIIFGIFAIIASVVIGFVCVHIMKKKGYETPAAWFFCGLFLGVIGLVICLVLQDRSQQVPPNNYGQYPNQQYGQPMQGQPYQPNMQPQGIRCPHCGAINPVGSHFCNGCGDRLN